MADQKTKNSNRDLKYWLSLSQFNKFGPSRFRKLKNFFSSMEEAFGSSLSGLISAGIESGVASEFIAFRQQLKPDKIIEQMAEEKVEAVTVDDSDYPAKLAQIFDPPPLLYYKGSLLAEEYCLAVVGTRKYSHYGRMVTEKIVKELALSSLTIVSGLALGIDSLAHNSTLEAGGRTIAVLASGLDRQNIYPSSNRYLADKIIDSGGLLVSEFPLGTPALKHHFPQRNRIISGLSLGALVIEAGEKSGALITAKFALEQNREVFAVPGSIFSAVSIGTNWLISQGAQTINGAADIIDALDLSLVSSYIENKKIIPASDEEKIILSFLSQEPIHIDELVRLTELTASRLNSSLLLMEMKGLAKNLGGMMYVRAL